MELVGEEYYLGVVVGTPTTSGAAVAVSPTANWGYNSISKKVLAF